jgi:hypothetical protein
MQRFTWLMGGAAVVVALWAPLAGAQTVTQGHAGAVSAFARLAGRIRGARRTGAGQGRECRRRTGNREQRPGSERGRQGTTDQTADRPHDQPAGLADHAAATRFSGQGQARGNLARGKTAWPAVHRQDPAPESRSGSSRRRPAPDRTGGGTPKLRVAFGECERRDTQDGQPRDRQLGRLARRRRAGGNRSPTRLRRGAALKPWTAAGTGRPLAGYAG